MAETHDWTARLERALPFGPSTNLEFPKVLPDEPNVIVRGEGCRVWDESGREFIDFRNGLGPVTLGYGHPAVCAAVTSQLEKGTVYGQPNPLECELAEVMGELVPGAEAVRFLKTGGEAVAATIRIARAYTGRKHIVQIGYLGWLNSLAADGRVRPGQSDPAPRGVPPEISALHHQARWNDIRQIEELMDTFRDQVAAVVVASDYFDMAQGGAFYPRLREITKENGALLIFDEIVTGFRIAIGGAQEYFGVTPDLSVFGKGMANGMPLSAYCGSREVMSVLAPGGVVVTSTFGGEALSLSAALACIDVHVKEDVVGHLWQAGRRMWSGVSSLFTEYELPLEVGGFWPCPSLRATTVSDAPLMAFFRMAFRHGVSLYPVSYVSHAHAMDDIDEALGRLRKACNELASGDFSDGMP